MSRKVPMTLELLRHKLDTVEDCECQPPALLDRKGCRAPLPRTLLFGDTYCNDYEYDGSGRGWGMQRSSYEDDSSWAVFYDTEGTLWVFEEWSDSTGHGCQCGAILKSFDNPVDAVKLGLSATNRERLFSLMKA